GSRWITPAEMEPTQRGWMNFPRAGTVNWPAMWQLSSARRAWTRLAETLNQYVPVTLLVDPDDQHTVTAYDASDIDTVIVAFENAVRRRTGFSVVVSRHPEPEIGRPPGRVLGRRDFTFKALGRLAGEDYGRDGTMPGTVMDLLPDTN